ncbi:ribonuclease P 40kDa subunit-domain-containing protein [Protomyces lactucae-debilis]|uniref:Ribonuclease P 40kDa subunit-domain-containing protein n=1 Tax=Protomyces lactucae-debilis TaxID=2754530 RepID=A0A1Y2FX50_PROLT|nr:ribonuclease P 40kDa subunit-domain-containing protein [Protomyces lactucae-debilis]ORY87756.1 ribonuclease P 40kDa subunit-domain-containing protein [Protomyces lactucae-debilis]
MHLLRTKASESKVIVSVNNENRIESSVSRHAFVAEISVLCPSKYPQNVPTSVANAVFYRCQLNTLQLLESLFVDVINGRLRVLSERKLDGENCICVESGVMTLSLLKETYQRMGLDGLPSQTMKGKWQVSLDFTAPGFAGAKNLSRVRKAFSVLGAPIHVVCCYGYGEICPDAASAILGLPVKTKLLRRQETQIVPEMRSGMIQQLQNQFDDSVFEELQEDLHTWLTLSTQGYGLKGIQEPFISVFNCPSPAANEEMCLTTLTGMFSPTLVASVLMNTRPQPELDSWSFVQMTGFEHTPVAWHGSEHGFMSGGENVVSVLRCHGEEQTSDLSVLWEVVGQDSKHT